MILAQWSTKKHYDGGVKGSSRHGQEPKCHYITLMLEKITAYSSARSLHSKKIRVRLLKEMKLIFLSWYFLHPGRQLLAKLLLGSNLSESTYFLLVMVQLDHQTTWSARVRISVLGNKSLSQRFHLLNSSTDDIVIYIVHQLIPNRKLAKYSSVVKNTMLVPLMGLSFHIMNFAYTFQVLHSCCLTRRNFCVEFTQPLKKEEISDNLFFSKLTGAKKSMAARIS